MVSNTDISKKTSGLKRYLSPIGGWALAYGCSVGWGAFVMPGTTFLPIAGPLGVALGMLVGAVIMLVIGFNYYYMMNNYPDAGGTFTYTKRTFGYDHGFLAAWFLCLTYIAIVWANMTAIALIARRVLGSMFQFGFHYQLAGYDIYMGEVLIEAGVLVLLGIIICVSKSASQIIQIIMALLLIVGIVFCFAAVIIKNGGDTSAVEPLFSDESLPIVQILSIVALTPWAFVGFESICHSTEEFRFPVKKSFAIIVSAIALGLISYAALDTIAVLARPEGYDNWVAYIADADNLEGIDNLPVFFAVNNSMGSVGIAILGLIILAGIITGIVGNSVAGSRLLYSMAGDGILPKWFGRLNKKGNPVNAITFIIAVSIIIPFFGRTAIGWIIDVATIGATITYGYTSAAAYRKASADNNKVIKATGIIGLIMSIFFALFLLIPNIWNVSALTDESYLILAIWGIIGFAFFRSVFKLDKVRRFGKSTVVWIGLLFLILFTSLMWVRLAIHTKTETVVGNISEYYINDMEDHGIERENIDVAEEEAYIGEQMDDIQDTLMNNSIVQMAFIVIGLVILYNVYSIIRKREKQMELDKIQAEENSKAKSTFLSNMSHDIRTPMNAIIGYINLAKREDISLDEIKEYMSKIEGSSQHLLALINDVLEMSRIESGKMELEMVDADLKKIMDGIHDMFATQMKEKGIKYTVDYSGITNRIIKCDKNRLNRVLLNLISNAYKFTPEDGSVEVTLVQDEIIGGSYPVEEKINNPDTGFYELHVKDSGIGMSEEFAAKVFEEFERERTSTVSGIQGTGLGMAITKGIIELMGGDISVNTSPGNGTEFVINLAFELGSENVTATEDTDSAGTSGVINFENMRLLLVDDIEINREIAEFLLEDMGFSVDTAVNGAEAVEKVKNSAPGYYNAVLMDIQMPVMNGYDATKAIRESDSAHASIPIIAMTANAFSEDVKKSYEVGMNGHIAKPIDENAMIDTLKEVLR